MPDEYISREAAVKIAEKYGLADGSVLGRHTGLADCIASEISALPAADVVEVVRCRDCAKHYVVLGRDMCAKNASGLKDHLIGLSATLPDAFCSRGVRKDGGENDVSG